MQKTRFFRRHFASLAIKTEMRFIKAFTAIVILLVVNSCVPSLHPLYTEDTLITNPEIEGTWIDEQDKDSWTFQQSEGGSYELTHKSAKTPTKLDAHLVKMGQSVFLDLYPKDPKKSGEMKDDLYTMHLVAAHTFSKIRIEGDFMYVAMLDPDRLRDAVKDGKFKIAYEVVENGIVLTAPTEDLQKSFLKYGEDETAYRKPRKVRRKLKDSASPDSVEATAPEKPAPEFTPNQVTPKKEPDAVSPFEFHSGFWVNLHHFLYQQARLSPEQSTYAYKLTPQQRKV